jgi:hypothetical protein
MDPQTHPDPIHEAMHRALQRAVQVASSVVTGAQVLAHLRRAHVRIAAEQDGRARQALTAQIRADQAADRTWWQPALDPDWLDRADLADTTRAWGMAMPYSHPAASWHDPAAATAMRRCEDRLRVLHPDAMTHYDQLRSQGADAAAAMREATPRFGLPSGIDTAARSARMALSVRPGSKRRPTARADRGGKPWRHDFPVTIGDVVASASAAAQAAPHAPVPALAATAAPHTHRADHTGPRP